MQLAGHPDSNYLEQGLALAALDIVRARQHQDCLYLHSESDNPEAILGAIASSSFLLQEGVCRLKVHGPRWALGIDLPISPDCQMAAQMVELLVCEPRVSGLTFKILLQQTCLNILCEFTQPTAQALVALPLLQVIRQTNPAAYFQSVTVSGRVKGERHPAWSFEIDLMALGLAPQTAEEPEVAEDFGKELEAPPANLAESWWARGARLGQWLFPQERARELHPSLAALAIVLSVGATLAIDQVLFQRARSVVLPEAEVAEPSEIPGDRPRMNFNIAALNEKLTLLEWHRTTYRRSRTC
ncbi:MAG: hypothetical protein HC919_01475 [Oscillatoriales cyanobacterium SM2_2_1]|nr:hypothetical protein [Oscillatoriales cyanobacterium SM2_2_1]